MSEDLTWNPANEVHSDDEAVDTINGVVLLNCSQQGPEAILISLHVNCVNVTTNA